MGFKSKYDAGGKSAAERYEVFKNTVDQLSMLDLAGENTSILESDVEKNQFCFPADKKSGNFELGKDIGYEASYVFVDPRFLAGETDEKSSSFYKVDVKDGKQTVKPISVNDMVCLYDPSLKGMEKSETYEMKKDMVLMNHFGFDSLKAKLRNDVKEKGWPYKSGNMRNDFDDFVRFTSDASDDFLKSIDVKYGLANDGSFGASLTTASGWNGRHPTQLDAEKRLFVDPRVADGKIPPEEGNFYFVSTKPMSTKFEKASLDDVFAFEKSEPAIEKPKRGFWGTVRDRLFGKDNPGRQKYEREKEIYHSKKCDAIEKKFGIKGLSYSKQLLNTEYAEKFINGDKTAFEEVQMEKNGQIIPDAAEPVVKNVKKAIPTANDNVIRAAGEVFDALKKTAITPAVIDRTSKKLESCFKDENFMKSDEGKWLGDFMMNGKSKIVDGKFARNDDELYTGFCYDVNRNFGSGKGTNAVNVVRDVVHKYMAPANKTAVTGEKQPELNKGDKVLEEKKNEQINLPG